MAGVKLVGCLQSWPRIYTRDYPEQVQLVATVELELGKSWSRFLSLQKYSVVLIPQADCFSTSGSSALYRL